MSEYKVYQQPEAVAQAAAEYIFHKILSCLKEKAICHVVLPGGSTPARCLELLSERELPWESIHWYPGDERCYPVGHAERNDTMIYEKLFSIDTTSQSTSSEHVTSNGMAGKNFHPIPAELGPEQGAGEYALLLDVIGRMDIVILGMGEDGHTASLFPGNVALDNPDSAVPVHAAPKPPADRVSIGLNKLRNATECIVIATGVSKNEVLKKIQQGEAFPVSMVEPDMWFVDEAAMARSKANQ